jgi:hypothetical protein
VRTPGETGSAYGSPPILELTKNPKRKSQGERLDAGLEVSEV